MAQSQMVEVHGPNNRKYYGDAYPTATDFTYAVGDILINTAPTAGGTYAWVCTTGGAPGTWKAIAIAA